MLILKVSDVQILCLGRKDDYMEVLVFVLFFAHFAYLRTLKCFVLIIYCLSAVHYSEMNYRFKPFYSGTPTFPASSHNHLHNNPFKIRIYY